MNIDLLISKLNNIPKDNILEFYEERAAVRQYDGGYSRTEAEVLAFQDTIDFFSLTNHILNTTNI